MTTTPPDQRQNADTGLIAWPTDVSDSDSDDGMYVYAYWPSTDYSGPNVDVLEVITRAHDPADVDQVFPRYMSLYGPTPPRFDDRTVIQSKPLAGMLLLGRTDRVMRTADAEGYWVATRADLTTTGRAVLDQLDVAYGRPAVLITHLST